MLIRQKVKIPKTILADLFNGILPDVEPVLKSTSIFNTDKEFTKKELRKLHDNNSF